MEKTISKVTFEFEDGSQRILEGAELEDWEAICSAHSDYLLPGGPDHVLAETYGGLLRGFVPKRATRASSGETGQ